MIKTTDLLIILIFIILLVLWFIYIILTIKVSYLKFLLRKRIGRYPLIKRKLQNNISYFGPFYLMDRSKHNRLLENVFVLFDKSQPSKDEASFNNWYHFKDILKTKNTKLISLFEKSRKADKKWLFFGRFNSFLIISIFVIFVLLLLLGLLIKSIKT
jgi:ABC-type sugar transport system permease subunit